MEQMQNVDPLAAVVTALKPLDSAERRRTVEAALHYFGDLPLAAVGGPTPGGPSNCADDASGYPEPIAPWLKQHGVTTDELDQVFHFRTDGTFDIHDVPGKTKKEKSLNTYVLTGLGLLPRHGRI